jgi:hypothetical protein
MALTFFEETLDDLEHAYSAALLEHISHQSRLDVSNSGSKLWHNSPQSDKERERIPTSKEELRDRSCQAHLTEYIKQYRLPLFWLQSATSEVPVARQTWFQFNSHLTIFPKLPLTTTIKMKFSIPILLSLLTSVAFGRPTVKDEEGSCIATNFFSGGKEWTAFAIPSWRNFQGDPLPQTSRVTAFVVDENGQPSVECWEFDNMVSNMKIPRKDGSVGTARSMKIAAARELDGLDILTWPSYSPIWPDPHAYSLDDEVKADWLDLSNTYKYASSEICALLCVPFLPHRDIWMAHWQAYLSSLFSVQGGLISFQFSIFAAGNVDEWPDHVFSLENGDDWFYFEDQYTGTSQQLRVDSAPPPIQFSSISGTETEVLRLRFPKRPAYKVLHKGGCSFTGISTPPESSLRQSSRVHNRLTKQQYGNTGL